ncbi:chromophore lyase CpcT/CpeT [Cyanobium sp. WAJ14-Wanaka]|uniref:chromophore lyase CpcT/CpeT n=1 Tax=Cyanobium sp. WAJ14-Wanaka TaxID=2823725 RepID=UPI0020CF087B|nr:chromophore lyase CpcT/CpeT [Cyanobium sp. WAJ14-Wanaka]
MEIEKMLHFLHTISGHFSNHEQAQAEPAKFSHINIFFRPLPQELLGGPWVYSEQSYDYDPWRPYRQGVHKIVAKTDYILMLNYGLREPMRCAGGGTTPKLLNSIKQEDLLPRPGCGMHFRPNNSGGYLGEVEPGCSCLIPRDGQLTYLVSEVEFDQHRWSSRDQGFDPTSHEYCWGSENGALQFTRMDRYADHLDAEWFKEEQRESTAS